MTTLFADLDLARRLEEAETFAAEAFVRGQLRRRPGADVLIEEVAGGRVCFAGAGSPLTEAKGLGLNGPVTDHELDQMERVFFSRGAPARVVVCPLADPSFAEGLGKRGYRLVGFENMLAMPLDPRLTESASPPSIDVRPIERDEADLYARVVAPNFAGPGESIDELVEMMATMQQIEHALSMLARIDGVAVGGGALLIHRGVALFAGAATLPPYRNRGVQAALHHARLAFARRAGCDLAVQGAQPGSTSQRNAERRGLQVAYTRAVLVRERMADGSVN